MLLVDFDFFYVNICSFSFLVNSLYSRFEFVTKNKQFENVPKSFRKDVMEKK